jgi:hypothetical protein
VRRKTPLPHYDRSVIWIAVAFCILALAGCGGYAAARAWRAWRVLRSTTRRANERLERVAASAAAAEARATGLTAGSERLAAATERLRRSLAELAVIRSAAAESQALVAALRGVVPRK